MRQLLSTVLLLAGVAWGQGIPQPNCEYKYRFTNRTGETAEGGVIITGGASAAAWIDNTAQQCMGWQLQYSSEGFTVISLNLQSAPRTYAGVVGASTPGTAATFSGTDVLSSLPLTSTAGGNYIGYGFYPYIRVNLATATGTGTVEVTLKGWKSITYAKGLGGGAVPAGSGSELQYRATATTLGALTSSSVSGANLTLAGTLAIASPASGTGFTLTDNTGALTQASIVQVASGNGNIQLWNQSRGTVASPTASLDADAIIDWQFKGYAAGARHIGAGIYGSVNGTPSAGTPGSLAMYVNGDNGAQKYSIVEDQTGIHLQSVTTDFVRVDTTGISIPAINGNQFTYAGSGGLVAGTNGMTWTPGTSPLITFSGSGLNDITASATTSSFGFYAQFSINTSGTPDTFDWSVFDSAGNTVGSATGVSVTACSNVATQGQTLSNGFKVCFTASTGHTNSGAWDLFPSPRISMPNDMSKLWIGPVSPKIATGDIAAPDIMLSHSGSTAGLGGGTLGRFIGLGSGYDDNTYSSQGSPDAPTALANGNYVRFDTFYGYDGTNYNGNARNVVKIDGAVSAGVVPMSWCVDNNAAGIKLRASGNIEIFNRSAPCFFSADLGIRRSAAGVFEVNTGTAGTLATVLAANAQTTPIAVGSLPTCGAGTAGMHAGVTDSNATSFTLGIGAIVANGGTTKVPVYCDGTNWRIG